MVAHYFQDVYFREKTQTYGKYLHNNRQTYDISRTIVGNEIVDHSNVVVVSPVGATNYIFIIDLTPGFNALGNENCKKGRATFKLWDLVCFILEGSMVMIVDIILINVR